MVFATGACDMDVQETTIADPAKATTTEPTAHHPVQRIGDPPGRRRRAADVQPRTHTGCGEYPNGAASGRAFACDAAATRVRPHVPPRSRDVRSAEAALQGAPAHRSRGR